MEVCRRGGGEGWREVELIANLEREPLPPLGIRGD